MPHPPSLPSLLIEDAVRAALLEDLGRAGDITTNATIAPDARATAVMATREEGIVAGLAFAQSAFRQMDADVSFSPRKADGEKVSAGDVLVEISGNARAILSAERVALNYMMRLCGIATYTSVFAREIAHTSARICDTRKTVPGHRAFDKYAVACGGGSNHRFGLDDAVLIKDNHIAVSGGVASAINNARAHVGHTVKIEIEVDTLDQLREALTARPDVILLDNMTPDQLQEAVGLRGDMPVILEASGNINIETVRSIAETGVDYISTSKITMAAPTLDIGLDIRL
jgi:nicotinate-nucleotide pyrophosphorylase (carboxylating)